MHRVDLNGPHAVYVIRSASGSVQYVGFTEDLDRRLAAHEYATWWHPTHVVTHEISPTRGAARVEEARLIAALKPVQNKVNWLVWFDRAEEIRELYVAGLRRSEVRRRTGVPAATLIKILQGAFPYTGAAVAIRDDRTYGHKPRLYQIRDET